MDWHVALAGLLIGLIVGFSGIGGSSLMLPVLVILFGVAPLIAVGTDLAYSVPTKIVGALIHTRQRTIRWDLVGWLTAGGIPASLAGVWLLSLARTALGQTELNDELKDGLGVLMIVIAATIVVSEFIRRNGKTREALAPLAINPAFVVGVGAVVGLLVSLTSIGAGSLTMVVLCLILPNIRLQELVGSDVAFAAIIIPFAALGHFELRTIDFSLTASLLLGSLPGVVIGSRLCGLLPDKWVRPAVAGVMVIAGSRLLLL
ncbi:MAG: sulfite exporter TauE/SafE family protein [Candidatus Eremiobacteraeota bacterium]|nr:sulfite exporter TauE/SafE family protein [Candidatus Eremiobacteraeota bacterium]